MIYRDHLQIDDLQIDDLQIDDLQIDDLYIDDLRIYRTCRCDILCGICTAHRSNSGNRRFDQKRSVTDQIPPGSTSNEVTRLGNRFSLKGLDYEPWKSTICPHVCNVHSRGTLKNIQFNPSLGEKNRAVHGSGGLQCITDRIEPGRVRSGRIRTS